jgi:hypothetical protein
MLIGPTTHAQSPPRAQVPTLLNVRRRVAILRARRRRLSFRASRWISLLYSLGVLSELEPILFGARMKFSLTIGFRQIKETRFLQCLLSVRPGSLTHRSSLALAANHGAPY